MKASGGGKVGGFCLSAWAAEHYRLLFICLLLIFAVLSLLLFDPKPFVGGDNAAYVALSKSLVQGKGLAEIWTPEERPHTQYPFGFPLLLAPISALGLLYSWYKLVPWLSGLLALMAFGMLAQDGERVRHLMAALLVAVSPHYLEYTRWVLSELPFTLFVMLAFLALRRWERDGHWQWLAGTLLASAAASHIRSTGLALYLGIFLYLLRRKALGSAVSFLAGCIVLTLPWALRNSHYGTTGGYLEQFLMRDPYQPELGFMGIGGLLQRLLANIRIYFGSVLPRMMFPSLDNWGLSGAAPVVALLAVVPSSIVLVYRIAKAPKGYDLFVLFYLGMSMLWPEPWSDTRFLLPLLPFLLLYLVQAYQSVLGYMFKGKALWPALALATLVVAANGSACWGAISINLEARQNYSHDIYSGYDPAWRSFFTAAEWVRGNTPGNSIVVSRKPSLFYLSAQRKSFCYPFTANRDSLLKALGRADYVMVEPVSGTVSRYLVPAIQPLLDQKFRIIYADGNPPTYVLKVLKEP